MWCHSQEVQGKAEERRIIVGWISSSQASITCGKALLARNWLDICLLRQSSELISYFAWLMTTAFSSLLNGYYLDTSPLACVRFLPCLVRKGSEQGWVFVCWLGSTHHISISNTLYTVWGSRNTEQTFESPPVLSAKHGYPLGPILSWEK